MWNQCLLLKKKYSSHLCLQKNTCFIQLRSGPSFSCKMGGGENKSSTILTWWESVRTQSQQLSNRYWCELCNATQNMRAIYKYPRLCEVTESKLLTNGKPLLLFPFLFSIWGFTGLQDIFSDPTLFSNILSLLYLLC